MLTRILKSLHNWWTFVWRKNELEDRIVWTIARDSLITGRTGNGLKVFIELIPDRDHDVIVVFDENLTVLDSQKFDPKLSCCLKVYGETSVLVERYVVNTEDFRALVEKMYELTEEVHWKSFGWIMAEQYSDFKNYCGDRLDAVCLPTSEFHKKFKEEEHRAHKLGSLG